MSVFTKRRVFQYQGRQISLNSITLETLKLFPAAFDKVLAHELAQLLTKHKHLHFKKNKLLTSYYYINVFVQDRCLKESELVVSFSMHQVYN